MVEGIIWEAIQNSRKGLGSNNTKLESNLKELIIPIAQKYLGMKPEDLGCKNWSEMQEKMTTEIISIATLSKLAGINTWDAIPENKRQSKQLNWKTNLNYKP